MSSSARLAWLLSLAVLSASACGQDAERARTPTASALEERLEACRTVDADHDRSVFLCQERSRRGHGAFIVRDANGVRELPVSAPGPTATASDAGRVGHWAWAALSPDGSMLLAQWSAECEIPIAFFVPAEGGEPRVVTGEDDWATSPTSVALGWTTDGRAIVLFPSESPCGTGGKAGLYLISVDGTHTRIRGVDRLAKNLPRSVRPRSVASLERG